MPRPSHRRVLAFLLASMGLGFEVRAELAPAPRPDTAEVAAQAGIALRDGFPVTRPDRIFPLDEVQPGLRGVGFTVFAGPKPEPFDVEVLGLIEDMSGPGEDVILARLSGARIEFTGVISGMSGSPVFVDGRLLGAVAFRFGQFAKEPIAGITPIERMLPLLDLPVADRARAGRAPRRAPRTAVADGLSAPRLRDRGRARRGELGPAVALVAQTFGEAAPIASPIAASGLHPAALDRLSEALGSAGSVRAAGAATLFGSGRAVKTDGRAGPPSSNRVGRAGRVVAPALRPAAPMAALLSVGDVTLSSIGTVTYVHRDAVLGFGHPFRGQGRAAYPLATAAIVNTLASPAGSYKQGLPALEVGSVLQDRLTAVSGRIGGARAPLVPVDIVIRDPELGRSTRSHVEVVDHPVWLPMVTDAVVSNAVLRRVPAELGGTVHMKAGFEVEDLFLEVEDSYAASAPVRVAAYAARDAATILALISRSELAAAQVRRVRIELEVIPEVRTLDLVWAQVEPRRVRRGETAIVKVGLRPFREPIEERALRIRIPDDAPLGEAELHVGGGLELDRRDADAQGSRDPSTLPELLGILADRRPGAALYARLYHPQDGLRIGARILPALPPSARATLSIRPGPPANPIDERPGVEARVETPGVVAGGRALAIEILEARGSR